MSQDFSKGKIYKITNDYNDDVYVGSTCDTLVKRFSYHKSDMNKSKYVKTPLYVLMNEIGNDRFRIELIEDYPCEDKYQLRQREGYYIRQKGTLNRKIECRTKKEYNIENADKIKKQKQEYNIENADEVKEYKKEYYTKNVEWIKQQKGEKIICECGCEMNKSSLINHRKTQKHLNLLQQQFTVQTI